MGSPSTWCSAGWSAIHIDDAALDRRWPGRRAARSSPIARMGYYDYTTVDNVFRMVIPGNNPAVLAGLEGSPDKARAASAAPPRRSRAMMAGAVTRPACLAAAGARRSYAARAAGDSGTGWRRSCAADRPHRPHRDHRRRRRDHSPLPLHRSRPRRSSAGRCRPPSRSRVGCDIPAPVRWTLTGLAVRTARGLPVRRDTGSHGAPPRRPAASSCCTAATGSYDGRGRGGGTAARRGPSDWLASAGYVDADARQPRPARCRRRSVRCSRSGSVRAWRRATRTTPGRPMRLARRPGPTSIRRRIVVIGWSNGASTVHRPGAPRRGVATTGPGSGRRSRSIRAAAAARRASATTAPAMPLLVLHGEADDWTPIGPCDALATALAKDGWTCG